MCPAILPKLFEIVLLVCNCSGNTHEEHCLDIKSVEAEEFCLINDSQCQKKAVLTFLLCCQHSPPEGLGSSQGEEEFCFHDSSIPGLQRRQPASGQSVAIVMGSWWCGCSDHQHISQEPFKSASSPGKWDHKLSLNLKNPTCISYQTPTSPTSLCVIYLKGGFYSIFSNDESKSTKAL